MTPALLTIRHICSTIKRFEFKELEGAVIPTLPEVSWNSVKSSLVKTHKNFTLRNVVDVISSLLQEANLHQNELKARLSTLEIIDVSLHHRRKIWYGYMLTGTNAVVDHLTCREIQNNIKDRLSSLDMQMEIILKIRNGVTYVLIKEQKKKSKVQRAMPIFFALFLGQKYFFCSKKNVQLSLIRAITSSLGYKSSVKLKLAGRDLESLSKLCWRRMQGALNPKSIDETPIYRDAAPIIKNTGIDFTQYKQRGAFAKKCFGEDPPTLESLVVNGPDIPWINEEVSSKMNQEKMHVTWEFRSHSIPTCLTKLIERRVIATPVPDYISNFMTAGRNEFTVRNE